MGRLLGDFQKHTLSAVFFLILFASLLLGDGKQPLVDTFATAGVGILFVYSFVIQKKPREFFSLDYIWICIIAWHIISAIFSDSAGYSVYSVVRIIDAYLLYKIFFTGARNTPPRLVVNGVMGIGVVATAMATVLAVIPALSRYLPITNLLYANYGHNQLASLLVFIFPVVFDRCIQEKKTVNMLLFLFILVGILFSFSRGAWILLGLYLGVRYLRQFGFRRSKQSKLFGGVLVLFFCALIGGALFSFIYPRSLGSGEWLWRQTVKPVSLFDARIEYWTQAVKAISRRPIFGFGPGTSFLISKRLQRYPNSYSLFIHSFPLQTAAELGLVGAVLMCFVLIPQIRLLMRMVDEEKMPLASGNARDFSSLATGALLTLIYSIFEMNLDFMVVWLLFWAISGYVAGIRTDQERQHGLSFFPYLCFGILIIFYLFSVGSMGVSVVTKKPDAAFFAAPYSIDQTLNLLRVKGKSHIPLSSFEKALIVFFHHEDPEIAVELARYYIKLGQPNNAQYWYSKALELDPKDWSYFVEYVSFLFDQDRSDLLVKTFLLTSAPFLPQGPGMNEKKMERYVLPSIYPEALKEFYHATPRKEPIGAYLARMYYFLGLDVASISPEAAANLWKISINLDPFWSFYYAELASLYVRRLNDARAAEAVLQDCLHLSAPRRHCSDLLGQNPPSSMELPSVGYYARIIKESPIE